MGLVGAKASVDLSALETTKQVVSSAGAYMAVLQIRRVPESRRRVRILAQAPDDVPALPFIWSVDPAAQARARRWYFANKVPKGSKGGRYQRTGELENSVDVQFVRQGSSGEFQMLHASGPAWDYVYTSKQVPSHYLTGWPQEDDILLQEAATLADQIVDDWFFVNTGERG